MLDTLLRLVKIVLALVIIGIVALMLANCAAGYVADEIPMAPATVGGTPPAIAEEAKAEWVNQVPESWAVIRAVVTSVEECDDHYLFRLDAYSLWLPGIKGYVTYSMEHGPGGGGTGPTEADVANWRGRWCGQR